MLSFIIDIFSGRYKSTDKPYPRGEILLGGGNIVQGYYKMPEKTKEDFTEIDGVRYFCTGDIGQIEDDGCLSIIGKEINDIHQTCSYIIWLRVFNITFNNISPIPQMQSYAHILTENPVYHDSCIGRGNLKVHLKDMIFHSIFPFNVLIQNCIMRT